MMTTLTYSTKLLGRALMPVPAGAPATVATDAALRGVPTAAATPNRNAATTHAVTADVVTANVVTGATWLVGSGVAGHMGFGSTGVGCGSKVCTNSIKRIHPGRLEGMT